MDSEIKNKNLHEQDETGPKVDNIALDDERRIRVLSPTMLVFKRFIRNRLAITGAVFIGFMFLFSFVGGWVMPYKQDQVFTKYVNMPKDYAAVSENKDFKFTTADGSVFPMVARSQLVLAVNGKNSEMSAVGVNYTIENLGQDFYRINKLTNVALAMKVAKDYSIAVSGEEPDPNFEASFRQALQSNASSFESGGVTYVIRSTKKNFQACSIEPIAIASMNMFDFATADADSGYEFRYRAELAMNELIAGGTASGSKSFTVGNTQYEIVLDSEGAIIYNGAAGSKTEYANISKYIVQAVYPDIFLTIDYKTTVKALISQNADKFNYTEPNGTKRDYTVERENNLWRIKWIENTLVIDEYKSPSWTHPVGTDGNGMDLLTRLMYGGRISLMIGFIVVFISTFIGVIIGGIAGYFKKYFDQLLMRLVDIFNSIPSLPLIIILGAMMDQLRVDPQVRIMYLMIVLGVLSWPGIARMTRGQILSLREQEFMIAAEATGLSSSRRIFKHLVPNVIPQLIVMCTQALGDVILIESVLSFLGLGVKFPFASWGNIINDVNNVYVLTNYPFVWIPAGLCILITVLGFNFIGDGLRDAFDPKMKR